MKHSYAEKKVDGKTYRFNTKAMAVEIFTGRPGGAGKWKTHVQCANSPELDAAWAALDKAGPQAQPVFDQAVNLESGWTLRKPSALGESAPADGATLARLTNEDGRVLEAVYRAKPPETVCQGCALQGGGMANPCPRSPEPIGGVRHACSILLGDWPGDVVLRESEAAPQAATELNGGWKMVKTLPAGAPRPADGTAVARLTDPDGKRYDAVFFHDSKFCKECPFSGNNECPDGKDKNGESGLACCILAREWSGDVTLRPAEEKTGTQENSGHPKTPPKMYLAANIRFAREPGENRLYWNYDGRRGKVEDLEQWKLNAQHCDDPAEELENQLDRATRHGGPMLEDDEWLCAVALEIVEAAKTPGAPTGPDREAAAGESVFDRLHKEPDIHKDGAAYRVSAHELRIKFCADGHGWKTLHKAESLEELEKKWRELKDSTPSKAQPEPAAPEKRDPDRITAGDVWTHPDTGETFDVTDGDGSDCGECDLDGYDVCPMHKIGNSRACMDSVSADGKALILKRRAAAPLQPPCALDDLARKDAAAPAATAAGESYMLVDVDRVVESPFQIRAIDENDERFVSLKKSIAERGLINPVRLRPVGGGNYELVAGHRRVRAFKALGLKQIPATLREQEDSDAEIDLIVENLQRQNLTPLEEADSIAALLGRGFTDSEAAEKTGVSEKFVYRRKIMARITPAWRAFVQEIKAGPEFIEAAGRLPPAVTDGILKQARNDWGCKQGNARGLQQLVRALEHRLEGCPWAKRHPEWCEGCPKRSDAAGAQPDLFGADAAAPAGDGTPKCLDPECWKKKSKSHVNEQKTELKHAHGTVLTANHWSAYNFAEKKSKTNCVPVLITDGPSEGTVR